MATGSRGKTESDKIKEVDCVNCGRTNPQKALICYWCGLDPRTGEPPYPALKTAALDVAGEMAVPVITLPPAIEVPPPMPLSELRVDMDSITVAGLTMPEVPAIEIAPPPGIPDPEDFVRVRRRRVRHRG